MGDAEYVPGDIIRIAPNELVFATPEAARGISPSSSTPTIVLLVNTRYYKIFTRVVALIRILSSSNILSSTSRAKGSQLS
jgi:hypothetical protein